jgi:ribonuclease Z
MAPRLNKLELGDPPIKLAGYSVAGEQTMIGLPEFDTAFDIGVVPRSLLSINNVCLSHGHMDHAAGLAYYFWQRDFQDNAGGCLLLPEALADPVERVLRAWSAVEGHLAPFELKPMNPGDRHEVRRDLFIEAIEVAHGRRVPALGYVLLETRRKLRPEFGELTGPEIVALKNKGTEITFTTEVPQVAYLGDTQLFDLSANPLLADARVLITECTFFENEHRSRAKAGFHMHVDDMPKLLEMSRAEAVVLTHVTRRTGLRLARRKLEKLITPEQAGRVHFLMERKREQG